MRCNKNSTKQMPGKHLCGCTCSIKIIQWKVDSVTGQAVLSSPTYYTSRLSRSWVSSKERVYVRVRHAGEMRVGVLTHFSKCRLTLMISSKKNNITSTPLKLSFNRILRIFFTIFKIKTAYLML